MVLQSEGASSHRRESPEKRPPGRGGGDEARTPQARTSTLHPRVTKVVYRQVQAFTPELF